MFRSLPDPINKPKIKLANPKDDPEPDDIVIINWKADG